MKKFEILQERIIALSQASTWEKAVNEWELAYIYMLARGERSSCLCTYTPITEVCVISNHQTGATAEVGNVCIKRFLGTNTSAMFKNIKTIMFDDGAAVNAATQSYAFLRGWLDDWQYEFYQSTWHKRHLSGKQLYQRQRANENIIDGFKATGPQGSA